MEPITSGVESVGKLLEAWAAKSGIGGKPRTQKYQREIVAMIRRRWPRCIGRTAREVTEAEVTAFAAAQASLSATRFNALVSALRAVLPAAAGLKRRPVRVKDRPLLSRAQFERLLAELDRRPQSHCGLVVRFLAHTGLRINEARQLTWQDVGEDFILVPGRITKNGRPRMIPFVNGIREALDGLRRAAEGQTTILPQAEVKRSLRAACERAGLPRLSHHDFRHLFATRCIQSGVDLPTVARWLGHLDGGQLLARVYFHLADEHSRQMAGRVRI